uniref:Uncharacterized protein n=1 Tax=Romanomermis culicivorax TaxID=13658 RepID=A0A915IG83_ROMCU
MHANTDPTFTCTDSSDSFINIDLLLAPTATRAPANDHRSSLAIANANEVHDFRLEAWDALEQLSTAAAQITNNVPMVQTIHQIISAVSDQFQAQQLHVQREIPEQVQATNACFTALVEQMQPLISTTTTSAIACNNLLTSRPPLVTSRATRKNANPDSTPRNINLTPTTRFLANNPNHRITTTTVLTAPQAATDSTLLSINPQVFGAMLTKPEPTTPKIVFGPNGKMLNGITVRTTLCRPTISAPFLS